MSDAPLLDPFEALGVKPMDVADSLGKQVSYFRGALERMRAVLVREASEAHVAPIGWAQTAAGLGDAIRWQCPSCRAVYNRLPEHGLCSRMRDCPAAPRADVAWRALAAAAEEPSRG